MQYEYNTDYLKHHQVHGGKWGVMHGPPYPLSSKISTGEKLKEAAASAAKKVGQNVRMAGTMAGINASYTYKKNKESYDYKKATGTTLLDKTKNRASWLKTEATSAKKKLDKKRLEERVQQKLKRNAKLSEFTDEELRYATSRKKLEAKYADANSLTKNIANVEYSSGKKAADSAMGKLKNTLVSKAIEGSGDAAKEVTEKALKALSYYAINKMFGTDLAPNNSNNGNGNGKGKGKNNLLENAIGTVVDAVSESVTSSNDNSKKKEQDKNNDSKKKKEETNNDSKKKEIVNASRDEKTKQTKSDDEIEKIANNFINGYLKAAGSPEEKLNKKEVKDFYALNGEDYTKANKIVNKYFDDLYESGKERNNSNNQKAKSLFNDFTNANKVFQNNSSSNKKSTTQNKTESSSDRYRRIYNAIKNGKASDYTGVDAALANTIKGWLEDEGLGEQKLKNILRLSDEEWSEELYHWLNMLGGE